jgi:hypothetical protein
MAGRQSRCNRSAGSPGCGNRRGAEFPIGFVNETSSKSFAVVPLPKARQAIIDAGGLIAYTRQRVMEAAGQA